jgi:opacity protein-like surface antigen
MKREIITTVMVSMAGVGAALAQSQPAVPVQTPPPVQYVAPAPYYGAPPPYYAAPAPYPPPAPYGYFFPPDAGPYFRAEAGPTIYQNGELKTFGGPASGSVHYRVGAMTDADFGYAFNKYIEAGIELGFNGTTIDSIPGYSLRNAQYYNVPFLANVTFSYPIPHTFLTPYIGGGAGGSDAIFDPDQMSNGSGPGSVAVYGSENDVVFAWEAYAGLRFQFTPNMSLGLGYKYFATGDPNFSYPPSPNFNVGFRGVETHSIMASFTLSFW